MRWAIDVHNKSEVKWSVARRPQASSFTPYPAAQDLSTPASVVREEAGDREVASY